MVWFVYLYIFIIGAVLGSFALAVASRWQTGKNWVSERSMCDHCRAKLQPIDLIPIISWALFRGSCRRCHKKLSWLYPAVEVAAAGGLLLSFYYFPFALVQDGGLEISGVILFGLWVLAYALLLILMIIDARTMLMPYIFLLPLLTVAIVFRASVWALGADDVSLLNVALAVAVSGGFFGMIYILSRGRWVGDSDIWLGAAIGLFLSGFLQAWIALFIASTFGLAVGIVVSKMKFRKLSGMKIAFGPFLIVGLYVAFLWADNLIAWYDMAFLQI